MYERPALLTGIGAAKLESTAGTPAGSLGARARVNNRGPVGADRPADC